MLPEVLLFYCRGPAQKPEEEEHMEGLLAGIQAITWQMPVMWVIGGILFYLAIKKDMEPTLLLPMGFGAILVNLPLSSATEVLETLFSAGIANELFPLLLFIGIGAMIDFGPLLSNPRLLLFGAAAQFGIFFTLIVARACGFDLKDAGAIAIIGAADGPTSIVVASQFAPQLLGPISVAAYSYMALVPIIQPPIIRALTSKKERKIRMEYNPSFEPPKWMMVLFPIVITVLSAVIAPISAPLIGMLMFGNLIKECGVLERLAKAAQNELSNIVTLLLGITIGATMYYEQFLQWQTLIILGLGLVAFIFDTAGGVLFAKLINVFSKKKVNPMVGAAGISAFPMASRIVQRMAAKEDPQNFILMQAAGANVAGQLGSVVAGGLVLSLVPMLLGA